MKNCYKIILVLLLCLVNFTWIFTEQIFAGSAPDLNCTWLPWCDWGDDVSKNVAMGMVSKIIWELIKYVAAIAVLSLMISWVMYIISWWEEEKVKKAKTAIIWSFAGVFLSISAWSIINLINGFSISF